MKKFQQNRNTISKFFYDNIHNNSIINILNKQRKIVGLGCNNTYLLMPNFI